jgi:hypothetical protein
LTTAPPILEEPDSIHIRQLHGLDISHDHLLYASKRDRPAETPATVGRGLSLDLGVDRAGVSVNADGGFKQVHLALSWAY